MSICDRFTGKSFREAKACNERLRRELDAMKSDVGTCGMGAVCYGGVPKPETVESVLNQFIALGHEKPVVVINGVRRQDGSECYKATIDGDTVYWRDYGLVEEEQAVFGSLSRLEDMIVTSLKGKLAEIVVDTIEITY